MVERGMDPSDEALYAAVLGGDQQALEELVRRYHRRLLQFVYRQTGDRHLAEDLVQELFTRLVTYRGAPPQRFRPWALTIARNLVHDHFRSGYARREHVLQPAEHDAMADVPDTTPQMGERLERADEQREVLAALQELKPNQREVLVLRFYDELKLEEIAAVTNAPLGTVKSRLFHALKQLQARLGRNREGDDDEESDETATRGEYRALPAGRTAG